MEKMTRFANGLDGLADYTGRAIAWLTLAMVLVTFAVVVMRYLFDFCPIALQESITYGHALVFMLGAAYTLKDDEHVRVDIFYRPLGPVGKARIDLLGVIFLLWPVCWFIFSMSYPYVAASWAIHEGSREAGGLNAMWLLKGVILAMPVLVALQGLAKVVQCLVVLRAK